MIQFVTNDKLRARLGISIELDGLTDLMDSAIMSAQLRLEGFLDTPLQKSTRKDVFYLDPSLHCGVIPNGVFRLRLSQAFVDPDSIVVKAGSSVSEQETVVPTTDLFLTDNYLMRGYLSLAAAWEGQYISVDYSAGYDADNKDTMPEWLSESILAYSPTILKFSLPQGDGNQSKAYGLSADHALAVAAPYNRSLGFAHVPVV